MGVTRVHPSICHPDRVNKGHGYCGPCYEATKGGAAAAPLWPDRPCLQCGKSFKPNRCNQKYDKIDCAQPRWRRKNPEAAKAWERAASMRPYHRRYELKKKYGLTIDDYDRVYQEQGGRCAICGDQKAASTTGAGRGQDCLVIDHCHTSGAFRGLLCHNCNKVLGLMRDDPARLRAAAEYLGLRVVARAS